MKQHSHVCKQVASFSSKKYDSKDLFTEPLINTPDGNFRPDLVVIDANRKHAFIADIVIPYEAQKNSLSDAEKNKFTKYKGIIEAVKFNVNTVSIEGLPVGARGALLFDKGIYCDQTFSSNELAFQPQIAIK